MMKIPHYLLQCDIYSEIFSRIGRVDANKENNYNIMSIILYIS